MFEAVVMICLAAEPSVCRMQLLPGFEAETIEKCEATLVTEPPDLALSDRHTAAGAPHCAKGGEALDVVEVAPGAFVHMGVIAEPDAQNRGDVSNLGFVIGNASVAVIDTGSAAWIGEALWRTIRQRTEKPVSHVIVTHMHPDHALGGGVFEGAGAQVIAHAQFARALSDRLPNYLESFDPLVGPAEMLGSGGVSVDVAVTDRYEVDLGGRALQVRAWPTAHTTNDLTVLDVKSATLFAGDLIFDRHTPALDGSLLGWQAVISDLEHMDLAQVVPGHGGPSLVWPAGAAPMRRYLDVLAHDTRAAIAAGQRLGQAVEVISRGEAAHWELFEAYNPRNATVAFTELEWE